MITLEQPMAPRLVPTRDCRRSATLASPASGDALEQRARFGVVLACTSPIVGNFVSSGSGSARTS
jgi:hypothetical protein